MILRPVRDDEEDAGVVQGIATAAFGAPRGLYGSTGTPTGRPETRDRPMTAGRTENEAANEAPNGAAYGDEDPLDRMAVARRHGRIRHLARTDPGGCWLIEDEAAGPVGAVLSSRREGTFGLSLLAVVPGAQGKEVGKALLARALMHGRACLRGIACAPRDPVAVRTLRRAGFTVHPAMRMTGLADPARVSPPDGAVHVGTERHRDLMDSVDRRTRGGAHGPDHEELLCHHTLFVVDDLAGSGYCYARAGRVEALAATSRRLATRLLTAALAATPPGERISVNHLTAQAQWAVDVGIAAGLQIGNDGFVCLRGMRPPELWLPSTTLL